MKEDDPGFPGVLQFMNQGSASSSEEFQIFSFRETNAHKGLLVSMVFQSAFHFLLFDGRDNS